MLSTNYYYPTVYHDNIFTSLSQDDVLNYDNVALLEQKICDIVGCKYCITTCNGPRTSLCAGIGFRIAFVG